MANYTQPPMTMQLARRLMLEQELVMMLRRSSKNSSVSQPRPVYSPQLKAASPSVYRPLAHALPSPQFTRSALIVKTLAVREAPSLLANTSLALEMARKQKLSQQQQFQQVKGQQQSQQKQPQPQQQQEQSFQQPLPQQNNTSDIVTEPTNVDVLLGRGGRSNHHVGNSHYRELIRINRTKYYDLPKHEKIRMSRAIVKTIQDLGGRFLEPAKDGNHYVIAPDKRAVDKTSQCLREKRIEGQAWRVAASRTASKAGC